MDAFKNSNYHNVKLEFQPKQKIKKTKKSNNKKVLYCNLPWNMAVKTNVGKEFLCLVDMFKNTPQAKYLNRHTVKISYSTMRNLKSHIAASNIKKLRPKQHINPEKECNCENQKRVCPVNGQCTIDNVVYEASVQTKHISKSYIGMTSRPFIERWKEHRGNLKHEHQKGTKLSSFVWNQKVFGENIKMDDIRWSLKTKAIPYRAGAKFCDTCLSEKTHIALADPKYILNSRKEIVSKCPHKRFFKLKFYKPP